LGGVANFSHTFLKSCNRSLKISYVEKDSNIASFLTTNVVVNKQ
jgi:hypothetical protein